MKLRKIDYQLIISFVSIVLFLNIVSQLGFNSILANAVANSLSLSLGFGIFIVLRRQGREREIKLMRQNYEQLEALFSLHNVLDLKMPLPKTRTGATSPDNLVLIYKEISKRKPKCIVECGAGVSTILIGNVVKKIGNGHLLTIENDATWANRVREWALEHGLSKFVTVVEAPIVANQLNGREELWYDNSKIKNIINKFGQIEFLYVDGPPFWIADLARYPAVPLLHQYFADTCIIVVDDANRNKEKKTINKWHKEYNYVVEWHETEKGTAILRTN